MLKTSRRTQPLIARTVRSLGGSIALAGLAAGMMACGGGSESGGDATKTPPPSTSTTAGSTSAAMGDMTKPQLIALGDSIFHGQAAGGICFTCHGIDEKGTTLAPDLTDNTWINGDGSLDFIIQTITNSVPNPKQHPSPMLPMGGATLTPLQIRAVANYEYSLSHPGG
jgi:mono/diheme cytochrome c family protein